MNQKYCPSGEFFLHSRQNTDAGYWSKTPDFVNFNFSDFFSADNQRQPAILGSLHRPI